MAARKLLGSLAGLLLLPPAAAAAPAGGRLNDPGYLCDGRLAPPSKATAYTEAALAIASGGVLGLLIPLPDSNPHAARGQAGIDACGVALAQATDDVRRSELSLARAIHRLEIQDFAGALAEARAAPALAGARADEPGFKRSLAVAGLDIEAVALAGLGRVDEAETTALRMAAAAPLDIDVALRAAPILRLRTAPSPGRQAFYETAAKLDFRLLGFWMEEVERRGDFAASAALMSAAAEHSAAVDPRTRISAGREASQALHYALAGDAVRSDAAAAAARALLAPASGVVTKPRDADEASRYLELRDIVLMQAQGRAAEARAALRARGNLRDVPRETAIAVLERLRRDAPASELRGLLRYDPAKMRAEDAASFLRWATGPEVARSLLLDLNYEGPRAYEPVIARVWSLASPSPLAVNLADVSWKGGRAVPGEVFQIQGFRHDLGRQALLLHAALRAKARGARGFALGPASQTEGDAALWVVYGDPGAKDFPVATTFVADEVIAQLAPRMPKPGR